MQTIFCRLSIKYCGPLLVVRFVHIGQDRQWLFWDVSEEPRLVNDALEAIRESDPPTSQNRSHHMSPFFNALTWPANNLYCLATGDYPFVYNNYSRFLTTDDFLMHIDLVIVTTVIDSIFISKFYFVKIK